MDTKEELVENIREWIKMDNDLIKLRSEIREKTLKKKAITDSIIHVMKQNQIDCFDIHDGALVYKKSVTKKPLTGKAMMKVLETYFQNAPGKAEEVTQFLMENREEQVKEIIRRKKYPVS